jgi:hypothetical protein
MGTLIVERLAQPKRTCRAWQPAPRQWLNLELVLPVPPLYVLQKITMKTRFIIPSPGDRPNPLCYDSDIKFEVGDSFLHSNPERNRDYVVDRVRFVIDDTDAEIVQLVSLADV